MKIAEDIKAAHRLKSLILADKSRPKFHFCVPFDLGFPADPNAVFFACGRWHLMYIYESREDSYRWGHAVSADLTHWSFLEDALIPDETDGGIYSGGVLLEEDGRAVVAYWSLGRGRDAGGIRIATAEPPFYEKWTKMPGYAVRCSQFGIACGEKGLELACADPGNLWKEGGRYYMQTGNLPLLDKYRNDPSAPTDRRGDWTDLFVSDNLETWEYVHRFYERDSSGKFTADSEDAMCPWFGALPLRDGRASGSWLQLFLSHNRGSQYYIGGYDRATVRFLPRSHGRMSFKDNCLFAPEAAYAPDGRLLAFHWLRDNLDDDLDRELKKGWSGIHALPRELWLREDGRLGIAPARELRSLRIMGKEYVFPAVEKEREISVPDPFCCELTLEAETAPEGKCGFEIFFDEEKSEVLSVYADFGRKVLVVDTGRSGTAGRAVKDEAPLELPCGEGLCLRFYLDGCTAEVFANDLQAMTRQVFPKSYESAKIRCFYRSERVSEKTLCKVFAYDMAATGGI